MTPWKILGIKAGSDRDTIRRAYARKLKGVNPEDDPDGFMRLRQAHDDALAQLRWRQQLADAEPVAAEAVESEAEPLIPVLADGDGEIEPPPKPQRRPAADPALLAEQSDLAGRQTAFVEAIAAGPEGQAAALAHLLAAPALEGISARDRIEGWIAAAIASRLPASDPLVVPAITHFGWGEIGSAARGNDVADLLQRREEGEFVARIARPHTELYQGYKALSQPPGSPWLARLGALLGGAVPGETRQILGLADGPLPGIADWLNADAMAFWRDWHSVPRLRLWMVLTMFPLAAVALVAALKATGWPQPVQSVLGVAAWAAPFGLLWLLRFRQRFQADWDRPDWQYRAWLYAGPALPLVAAAWPPVGALAPLWLIFVTLVTALTIVSVNRLLPDAPKTLMISLVRAWPAWALLAALMLGPALPDWARPVLGLLVAGMAIIWWQGGDELAWLAQNRLGRWSLWLVTGAAALIVGGAWWLLGLGPDWQARGLALLVLALLLALIGFRQAQDWRQLAPALVMIALFRVMLPAAEQGAVPAAPATASPQALGSVGEWLDAGPALRGQPPGDYRFTVSVTIDTAGRVSRCELLRGTGVAPLDRILCPDLMTRARYRPAQSSDGKAVAADLSLTGGWTVRQRPALTPGPEARPQPITQAPPPPPAPQRRAEPVISCPPATGSGPMVAEPCMRGRWIGDGDYPAAALAQGQQGKVGYRLLIDAKGRVQSCDITESSGHAALDKGTCDLIRRRARFVPARGADGQPMEWSYRSGVDWELRQP